MRNHALTTPSTPDTIISAIPSFPLTEYLIYIMSCVGSWYGLSVIGLNPARADCERGCSGRLKSQNRGWKDRRFITRAECLEIFANWASRVKSNDNRGKVLFYRY